MKSETKYIKALKELTSAVIRFEDKMDIIMKQPSGLGNGRKIAESLNELTISNQSALHFTLGYSFNKIKKLYGLK